MLMLIDKANKNMLFAYKPFITVLAIAWVANNILVMYLI